MNVEEISDKIDKYKASGLRLFTTSSFQSHSLVLLHILSKIDNQIPVYFLQTGYHFPETIAFRNQITELFNLNLKSIESPVPRSMQKDNSGKLLFASDPDYCCYLNKTLPVEKIMGNYDVWINGVRGDQTKVRSSFKVEENAGSGVIRFHPMLDWDRKTIFNYLIKHNIPYHPLDDAGYSSIGCEPCTRKVLADYDERNSRWFGMSKTECGLNTDLIVK